MAKDARIVLRGLLGRARCALANNQLDMHVAEAPDTKLLL